MPIAIIPARGGSRRIKRKNIRLFHGEPIISYSIKTARETGLFDRIVVSTNDHEIAAVAGEYETEVHFRPEKFGADEIGTQEVAQECINSLEYQGQYACVIYATAPLITSSDLVEAFTWLDDFDYVFSVGYPPLIDAGAFYWGKTAAFANSVPLVGPYSRLYLLPKNKVCDINTKRDFLKAERMYKKIYR